MTKRIFISYKFTDAELARNLRPFFQQCGGKCEGTPVYVEKDVSKDGESAIDAEIRRVMLGCECAVFVVGADSHNSPWIRREAELAKSLGLGIVAVRLPNSTGGLPREIAGLSPPVVDWNVERIAVTLNQLHRKR